VKVGQ
jgi:hypothetical protein